MKKTKITQFSKKGFSLFFIATLFGILFISLMFNNLEKINKKTIDSKELHKSILDIKNSTQKLLSSRYIEDDIKELNKLAIIYDKKLKKYELYKNSNMMNDWLICMEEIKSINQLISHKYFNDVHLKNRPLLRIEGELFSKSASTDFYRSISKMIILVEYLLQYENFILNFYEKENIKNNLNQNIQMKNLKYFASIGILIFILLLIIISMYIVNVISKNEQKLILTTKELENGLIKLENAKLFIKNILDNIPVRIFWKDKNSIYLGANKLFLEDMGLKNEHQLIGNSDYELVSKKLASSYQDDDENIMKNKQPKLKYEEEVHLENGNVRYVITSKIPLYDKKGDVIGILGIYDDISEQKKLMADILKKESMLVQQSRLAQMGEMISMIAHQWRQPLSAISSTSIDLNLKLELENFDLEQSRQREEFKAYFIEKLQSIDSYVQSLTYTIDDFRNFYKPNKKRELTLFNVPTKKALSIMKGSILSDGIEIIELCTNCDKKVNIYSNEMMQVILNILKNSQDNFRDKKIKQPRITIACECAIDDKITLNILDNGGGIPENIIENIFDPYFSTKDEKNGTGLGLYMSKIIIENHHNGKLKVKNTNEGVCFTIELEVKS